MKIFRLARLALALSPLTLGLAVVALSLPMLTAPAVAAPPVIIPQNLLPPGAPPFTAAQKQKYVARMQRFDSDMQALQANAALSPAQKQQQMAALQQSLSTDMLNILTPQQRAAVQAQNGKVIALQKQFYQEHQADIVKQQQLQGALAASLTPAQKQKISSLQQSATQQIAGLRANSKMSATVKERTAQGIIGNATQQAMAVLNPTQQTQMKQLRALQVKLAAAMQAFAKAHKTP